MAILQTTTGSSPGWKGSAGRYQITLSGTSGALTAVGTLQASNVGGSNDADWFDVTDAFSLSGTGVGVGTTVDSAVGEVLSDYPFGRLNLSALSGTGALVQTTQSRVVTGAAV